jgi:hypothetical protein
MTVFFTAISPASAGDHEAIAAIWWLDTANETSASFSKATAVAWLNKGNQAWVADSEGKVAVRVVDGNPPYVRTYADGRPTDNLLALPRF